MRTRALLVLAALLSGLGVASASAGATAADEVTCLGKPATMIVPPKDHFFTGTDGDDVIVANHGYTQIYAGGGDDTICLKGRLTYAEGSYVRGEGGEDTALIVGSKEDDAVGINEVEHLTVDLGAGDDEVGMGNYYEDPGEGVLDGGPGQDTVRVGSAAPLRVDFPAGTLVFDGDPAYVLSSFENADAGASELTLIGNEKDNLLEGTACKLTIGGGAGDDKIVATHGSGEDCFVIVRGAKGDDHVVGTSGNDKILGGPGDDYLVGALGNDKLLGGPGRDRANGKLGRDACIAEIEKACEQ